MSEVARIADQLQRSHGGGAWHGPALDELLADVTAAEAAARPVPGAHTIWQIVLHLGAWIEVGHGRAAGEAVEWLAPEDDWPAVGGASSGAWDRAREGLAARLRELRTAVADLADERLADAVSGSSGDLYGLLHGIAQHNAYHGGQIALLKKLLRGGPDRGAS